MLDLLMRSSNARTTTLVMVTHDPSARGDADAQLVLRDGRAVGERGRVGWSVP